MDNKTFIYVVSAGESSEGHSPAGVYRTLAGARKSRPALIFRKEGVGIWKADLPGIDEVYIERFRLND